MSRCLARRHDDALARRNSPKGPLASLGGILVLWEAWDDGWYCDGVRCDVVWFEAAAR